MDFTDNLLGNHNRRICIASRWNIQQIFYNDQVYVVPTLLSVLAYICNVFRVMMTSHKHRFCLLKLHLIKAPCGENYAP